jgi:hypothetical protein
MKRRERTTVLLVAVLTACVLPLGSARGMNADRSWSIVKSNYPPGTHLSHPLPENQWLDGEFGGFLDESYEQQGRIDGRGWVQVGFTTYPRKQGLTLEYAVSYFGSEAQMRHAAQSISILTAHPLTHGLYGGSSTSTRGNAVFSVYGRFNVLVDQYCWLTSLHTKKEGQQLSTYCAMQRKALTKKLLALTPPPTPVTSTTATPAGTPPPTGQHI